MEFEVLLAMACEQGLKINVCVDRSSKAPDMLAAALPEVDRRADVVSDLRESNLIHTRGVGQSATSWTIVVRPCVLNVSDSNQEI